MTKSLLDYFEAEKDTIRKRFKVRSEYSSEQDLLRIFHTQITDLLEINGEFNKELTYSERCVLEGILLLLDSYHNFAHKAILQSSAHSPFNNARQVEYLNDIDGSAFKTSSLIITLSGWGGAIIGGVIGAILGDNILQQKINSLNDTLGASENIALIMDNLSSGLDNITTITAQYVISGTALGGAISAGLAYVIAKHFFLFSDVKKHNSNTNYSSTFDENLLFYSFEPVINAVNKLVDIFHVQQNNIVQSKGQKLTPFEEQYSLLLSCIQSLLGISHIEADKLPPQTASEIRALERSLETLHIRTGYLFSSTNHYRL